MYALDCLYVAAAENNAEQKRSVTLQIASAERLGRATRLTGRRLVYQRREGTAERSWRRRLDGQ